MQPFHLAVLNRDRSVAVLKLVCVHHKARQGKARRKGFSSFPSLSWPCRDRPKKKKNCERLTAHRLCCIITPQWVIERRRLQHTKSLTPGLTRVCAFTCVYVYVYEGCDGKTLRSNAK